jgi:hypothetical protein
LAVFSAVFLRFATGETPVELMGETPMLRRNSGIGQTGNSIFS